MGAVTTLAMVALLLAAQTSWAVEVRRRTQDPERLAPFGLMLDAGVEEGAGLSLSFSPLRMVRLHAGGTHNGIRGGGRVGLTLLPLRGPVTPALSLELGHAQPANTEGLERRLADRTLLPSPSFERLGYNYASALLGLEMKAPGRLTFFVRGGFTYVELFCPGFKGLDEPFQRALAPEEERAWKLHMVRPTAKLGVLLSFG